MYRDFGDLDVLVMGLGQADPWTDQLSGLSHRCQKDLSNAPDSIHLAFVW